MQDVRFGIVGWGYWGPKLMRNLAAIPGATVTSVADTDEARLSSLKHEYPWVRAMSSAEQMFQSEVDAVAIATPVQSHFALAKRALQMGKHVLVEKPLTARVAEAEE